MKRCNYSLTAAVTLIAAGSALGQTAAPKATPFAPGTLRVGGLPFSGSLRSRVEGFDWFQPTTGENSYAYTGNILRFGVSKKMETWDWNAEFAAPFLLGLPSNAQGSLD